ncbi:hypothetical protein D3878_08180 [Noviherbaspirillum sedimenti]|uniref:Uncharacterized protein n=1 Tax=Noviherbaspirillum sedimenti TaxID=2320865 RepID=A0A3A3G1P1_9BURK|nr:hypothetical protein D3878_08180 [Noviherbaspirillum sedimenti]
MRGGACAAKLQASVIATIRDVKASPIKVIAIFLVWLFAACSLFQRRSNRESFASIKYHL